VRRFTHARFAEGNCVGAVRLAPSMGSVFAPASAIRERLPLLKKLPRPPTREGSDTMPRKKKAPEVDIREKARALGALCQSQFPGGNEVMEMDCALSLFFPKLSPLDKRRLLTRTEYNSRRR